jgi:hypothetical protein
MCELIKTSMRTNKGFKEVHMTAVAKTLPEHCCAHVSLTQVYKHLTKWRVRLLTISKLHNLRKAQWCEETKCAHHPQS